MFLVQLQVSYAVKSWMFKRCDQNPFCERNRELAADNSFADYFIDPESIDTTHPESVSGRVVKLLTPSEAEVAVALAQYKGQPAVFLPFTLDVVTDDIVHFTIDEENRQIDIEDKSLQQVLNSRRFDPADFMLDNTTTHLRKPTSPVKVVSSEDSVTVEFGKHNAAVLDLDAVKLTVKHKGDPQVVVNKKGYLNYDHLRRKRQGERNADWEDRFDNYLDKHVRGPESVAVDTHFEGYTHLYGIPEHADSLSLKDTRGSEPYRLFNVDIFEYETDSRMPMYGSIPLITSHRKDHAAGVFWLNAADTYVDITKGDSSASSHWISETGVFDMYVIVGEKPSDVLASYGLLTGTSQLPQEFAVGYHQCRWNYMSQDELLSVNAKMDAFDFPYDVIWLDLEWSDDRRYFAWNTDTFPNAEDMMATLDETNRKLVILNDPHIKAKRDYNVFNTLRDEGLLIKDVGGVKDFHAHCWPGDSVWIDTLHPLAAAAWSKFHALGTKLGGFAKNLHLWSDMSEPSVFSGSETTAYKGVVHHGGWQHRDVHNVYGHTVFNATYDALYDRYGGQQRPFILTRSFFSGSQKLGPTWTGDNQAEWEYLQVSAPMILTLGASGYPFAGSDVGGFFRNPSDELLVRWYQAGAFFPFYRAHAHVESRYREPYLLDEQWRTPARNAIELRYQLLPEIYSRFWDANQVLQPIMRPLYFDHPDQPELNDIEDQFFLGPSLMAKPIVEEGVTSTSIVFPGTEVFYDYFSGRPAAQPSDPSRQLQLSNIDINTVPLYVKGGSVVFRKDRKRRSTELMRNDPYTLMVAFGNDGTAKGHLYVDDGISFDYEIQDDYLVMDVSGDKSSIHGRVRHPGKGKFADAKIERIIVYGGTATKATVSGLGEEDVIPLEHGFLIRNPGISIGKDWDITLHEDIYIGITKK